MRFPPEISYGSRGGARWASRRLKTPSGNTQTTRLWDTSLIEWDFERKVWIEEELNKLLSFWQVIGGPGTGFRFKDWSDYYLGMERTNAGLAYTGDPHEVWEGDGATVAFQLARIYEFETFTRSRKITRPVASTVKMYSWNGSAWVEIVSGFTVNYGTGVVTFSVAPADNLRLAWAGEYDWPAEFDSDLPGLTMLGNMRGTVDMKIVGIRE